MGFLSQLWLPIVVSAVVVWIVSAVTHMVLPFHKADFGRLPDEDKLMGTIDGVNSGNYVFPYCEGGNMKNPEYLAKLEKGPSGTITIYPGPVNMGQNLILTLLFYVVVGVFVAYFGAHSHSATAGFMTKMKVCTVGAFACHGLAWFPFAIWYRSIKLWSNLFDSVLFSLITGLVFAMLWK